MCVETHGADLRQAGRQADRFSDCCVRVCQPGAACSEQRSLLGSAAADHLLT